MRTKVKLKGGISLIVLVITIIVMIILAAAIILSLSNSGIISKANKAKTDSDTASLKEYVNTLRAEWELMTTAERETCGSATFEDYANKKLEENDYKGAVGADGEVYSNLNENARKAIAAGIMLGDEVKYNAVLTEKSYTTDGSERTSTGVADSTKAQIVKTNTNGTWKYIGLGEDGNLLIALDMTGIKDPNYNLTLGDKGGYLNGPTMLNTVCDALYTVEGKGKAKSMNIEIVNKLLEYNGPKGSYINSSSIRVGTAEVMMIGEIETNFHITLKREYVLDGKDLGEYKSDGYTISKTSGSSIITKDTVRQNLVYQANWYWLASSCVSAYFSEKDVSFQVRYVYSADVFMNYMFSSDGRTSNRAFAVRPVVSLTANVQKTTENGKTVWILS